MTTYKGNVDRTPEEAIEHSKCLYKESHLCKSLDKKDKIALGKSSFKILQKFLPYAMLTSVIKFKCFIEIINDTILNNKFNDVKSAQAFAELEKYFMLLYNHPWKKEFQVLKLHSGFFNVKIKSHLSNPEQIFILVGYCRDGDSQLILKHKPDRELIFDVCFECLVAEVLCGTIGINYNEIKERGGDVNDAFLWIKTGKKPSNSYLSTKKLTAVASEHKTNSGLLETDYSAYCPEHKTLPSRTRPRDEYLDVETACSNPKNVTSEKECIAAAHIPFIDDGVDEGTLDDHIHASLREVNLKEKKQQMKTRENGFELMNHNGTTGERSLSFNTARYSETPSRSIYSQTGRTNHEMEIQMSLEKREADKVYFPPDTSVTLPNLRQHKRRNQSSHNQKLVDVTDSGRTHLKPTEALVDIHQQDPLFGLDGASSFMSNYFDAPLNNDLLYMDSLPSHTLPLKSNKRSSDRWTCSYCTSYNDGVKPICISCHKSRHPGPDLDNPKAGDMKKVCTVCTLENQPCDDVCSVCGSELKPSNVQTYV